MQADNNQFCVQIKQHIEERATEMNQFCTVDQEDEQAMKTFKAKCAHSSIMSSLKFIQRECDKETREEQFAVLFKAMKSLVHESSLFFHNPQE